MDIEQSIIEISKIKESPINPQVMQEKDFRRLVNSLKKDKNLTSAVLLMKQDNGYMCISGHHRIRAARKANIKKVPAIIIHEITDSERIRLQLTHNDIHGEPDQNIVNILKAELSEFDVDLIDYGEDNPEFFLDEIDYNITEYSYVNICLLGETRNSLVEIIENLSGDDTINYLIEKPEYEEMRELLTQAHAKGFKTPGRAFGEFLRIVKENI